MDILEMQIVGTLAIIVILLWIGWELRQARKHGRQKYYITNNASIYNDAKDAIDEGVK